MDFINNNIIFDKILFVLFFIYLCLINLQYLFEFTNTNKFIMTYSKIINKVKSMNSILKNTESYRKEWKKNKKKMIINNLEKIVKESGLIAEVIVHDQFEGLEAISLTTGTKESGIYEKVSKAVKKPLIRIGGMLMFQQLFNGKISIWVNYPYIEGIGDPKAPKMLEIVRPHELKDVNILRYAEQFIDAITEWEDYDDDIPPAPGIGFNHQAASIK